MSFRSISLPFFANTRLVVRNFNQTFYKTILKNFDKILRLKSVKTNLIIVCILFFTNNLFSQDCKLPNGKYKIEFNKQFEKYPKFEFLISNDYITFFDNDTEIKRRIEKNNDCRLVIEKEKIDETNLTEFQKIINKQHLFYTFKKINSSDFEFIYRVDLHIMINSGKFIKLD